MFSFTLRFMSRTANNRRPSLGWLFGLLLTSSITAQAATPGETLEQAIYAEETVGNLDEAIQLYEQVVAQGQDARRAAAQAQYRLGLCFQKQQKSDQALAAFRAVVENFKDQTEWVAKAQEHLSVKPNLLPVPWVDGEQLQLEMRLASGIPVGTMIYMIDAATADGRSVWQATTRGFVSVNNANSFSRVVCDAETFAPLKGHWKHSLLGDAEARYEPHRAVINVKGREDAVTIKLDGSFWDNEQGVELFRRLPLEVGYKSTVTFVTSLASSQIGLTLEVPKLETITVPAGTFECYKLVLDIGQTFWISTDQHRYLVRFDAGGVIAELTQIAQRGAAEPRPVSVNGLSLTLPEGWHTYQPSSAKKDDEVTRVFLLDREAVAQCELSVGPRSSLKPEQRESARAWTESVLPEVKSRLTDFQLREPGLVELNLGGRAACAIIVDHTDNGRPLTLYGIAVVSDQHAATLKFTVPTEDFAAIREELDTIVNRLKLE